MVLRPVVDERLRTPSLSVIVPAQNDHGNVAAALGRLPALTSELEVLFVEGHSTDGTWDEIDRVAGGPNLSRPAGPGRPEPLAPRPPGDPSLEGTGAARPGEPLRERALCFLGSRATIRSSGPSRPPSR